MADILLNREEHEVARRRFAPFTWLATAVAAEGERQALWLPVSFGSGIALYFALTVEPPWWPGPAVMLAAIAGVVLLRRMPAWRSAAICLAFFAAGFALIGETTRERAAPML